jgi:nucleotide-binding universal stress UspA family protein
MAQPRSGLGSEDGVDERGQEEPMSGRVVVGVDGSEAAMDAVRWAAREAKLRGMKLELVSAWEIPIYDYVGGYGFAIPDDMTKGLAQHAEDIVAAASREARAEAHDLDVEPFAAEGRAAKVLLEVASGADLLVVGSRGLGGFRDLLLGSVSQQCAQHATCPVVIIRHVAHAAGADA